MTPALRGVTRAVATASVIAVALFLLFVGLAHLSLRNGSAAVAGAVNAAFAEQALDRESSWRFGDTEIGAHQYNDCLILYQAMDQRAPAARLAISPLSVPVKTDDSCAVLADVAAGQAAPAPRYYHQYLHAHTTLARMLVPAMGVSGLRGLYKLALTIALLAGIGTAVIAMTRRRRVAAHAAWLAIFLVFARGFGLESFGQSLGHGPADLVAVGFLLFVQRMSVERALSGRAAVLASGVFGALTMQFEFLTGGLPLGLAIVIGALPLALAQDAGMGATLLRATAAYATGAVVTALCKLALVAITFGGAALVAFGRQFLFRAGLSDVSQRDVPVGPGEFGDHLWAGLEGMAPGMHALIVGLLLIAVAAGIWGWRRLRREGGVARLRANAIAASMLVPPLWLVALWQHSAQHAWFMDRILAWDIAAGAMLFALAIGADARREPD